MNRLHRLLLCGLYGNRVDRWPRQSIANRFGVIGIVLSTTAEGADILCRDQSHLVAKRD
jgi:hypothetical protein